MVEEKNTTSAKHEDLVSIIIPAYNIEKLISETIKSVVNQTHTNVELIVVDDGSTDNTSKIVEAFCNQDSRIKLIQQKNQGVSAARNNGFEISKGRYIAYLDGDDLWEPGILQVLIEKIDSDTTLGLAHADGQQINESSQKINAFYPGKEGYLLENLLLEGGGGVNCISGAVIKREVIETVGGFDVELANGEDHELSYRIAQKYKIGSVSHVKWYYRIHSGNAHTKIELLERDAILVLKKAEQHRLFKNAVFKRKCFSNKYLMLAGSVWPIKNGKRKAINYLIKSILQYPPVIITIFKKILPA
jgi:glycosyltransferase involved in cell wall biosynthesis